jgi:PAS domain-containing protein
MHSWKLEQLEAHLKALEQAKQPIPHSLSVLVADAKRKEEKRTAKRVANRKSACASRERKKALVEDMTRMNKLLKREAMILSLLPDLVIAVTTAGKITFCSGQVERVLRHKTSDLLGANISQIIVPSSREALTCLIHKLIAAQLAAMDNCNKEAEADDNESYSNSGGNTSDNHIVSEQSEQGFPLSVVSVKNRANVSNETDPESFNDTKESTSKSSRTLKSASSGQSGDNQGSTSPKNSGTEYAEN